MHKEELIQRPLILLRIGPYLPISRSLSLFFFKTTNHRGTATGFEEWIESQQPPESTSRSTWYSKDLTMRSVDKSNFFFFLKKRPLICTAIWKMRPILLRYVKFSFWPSENLVDFGMCLLPTHIPLNIKGVKGKDVYFKKALEDSRSKTDIQNHQIHGWNSLPNSYVEFLVSKSDTKWCSMNGCLLLDWQASSCFFSVCCFFGFCL